MYSAIPTRCEACDRYCDGCSFSKVYQAEEDPLAAAKGVLLGALLGLTAWSLFVGFLLAAYYGGVL